MHIGIGIRIGGNGGAPWDPVTNYISALSVLTTSDTTQTITATIVGTDYDGVSFEYSDDGGATWSAGITDADGVLNQTGLTAGTDYTWRARLYKGVVYGDYVTAESSRTFGIVFAILDTITNTDFIIFSSLAQHPTNKNKVINTYLEGVSPNYDATKILKIRTSNDKGRTWGAASTAYDPGGILCVQEQHSGYTSDGRLHILCTLIDDVAACSLIYLYSDNDGVSFTTSDISALVADVTYVAYRNSGALIENNGVLLTAFYSRNAAVNSFRRLCLRLVTGTWTKVTVETTAANETESSIEVLSGNNLIMLTRDDAGALKSFIQYKSADNGLTWTRLGVAIFGLAAPTSALPGQLRSFLMDGKRVIVFYFPYADGAGCPLNAIYGYAEDLLDFGIDGWITTSLKAIVANPNTTFGKMWLYHGDVLHYDNNYSAIACIPSINSGVTASDLRTFDISTTDYAAKLAAIFTTFASDIAYVADSDSNAFNAVNNTNPTAINNLVGGLKAWSLWTKIKAAYPFIGGTAALHQYNLVNPADSDGAFRLHFVADHEANHTVNGYKPNGSDQIADTHLNASSGLTLYSAALGYYSRDNVSEAGIDMGAFHALGTTNPCLMLRVRYTDGKGRLYSYNGYSAGDAALTAVVSDSRGWTLGSRTANNVNKIYINSLQSGATVTATALNATANFTIYIGGNNADGTAASFTTKECAFAVIMDGVTDIEAKNLFRIIHYFQKALGRNV